LAPEGAATEDYFGDGAACLVIFEFRQFASQLFNSGFTALDG
jgi:hypothetical protein